jgi:hypothetical protein|tara:strand:- start:799 stop:1098 length:300 start_codon:yes stop_codon:yes gene_type:complete
MIKVVEVYEEIVKNSVEKPDGSLQVRTKKKFSTRDCLLNKGFIVRVVPHEFTSSVETEMLAKEGFEDGLFSRVIVDGNTFRSSELIVASSFQKMQEILK